MCALSAYASTLHASYTVFPVFVSASPCVQLVYVCVSERERDREKESEGVREREREMETGIFLLECFFDLYNALHIFFREC